MVVKRRQDGEFSLSAVRAVVQEPTRPIHGNLWCRCGTGEEGKSRGMTQERINAINEWLSAHCQTCIYNNDAGSTEYVDCQEECEVEMHWGIACIHYEER